MNQIRFSIPSPRSSTIESWPWPVRALLGGAVGVTAVGISYAVPTFHAVPLLLAFPAVVLSSWFFGMGGGTLCALTEAGLVDMLLTKNQMRLALGDTREVFRMSIFLVLSIFLGWAIRELARQKEHMVVRELQQRLVLADTERLLAEERARASEALRDRDDVLQIALRANGMGLWVWNLENGTVDWSDEVYRILGREPGSIEPGFMAWSQIIHQEDRAVVQEAAALAGDGSADFNMQYRVVWPDGTVRWVESQGKSQAGSDGRQVRVVGVLTDVTSRKLAEDAMLRAEKLAVAGRLAASIAHEINNPLEAVMNLLYLITTEEGVAETQAHARQALEELMRVSMITQQTLKFHRQAGRPRGCLVSEVMQSVLTLVKGKLIGSQVDATVQVVGEVAVECMPGEIQQIFLNLVSNAIDAMPRGGTLAIRMRAARDWRDGETEGMRVTFADSGTGMDQATLRRIFEPFFTTKSETGTGLGMWVVSQLVERHRGQVRVKSAQGPGRCGTVFSVFLPRRNAAMAEVA